jgi:restriction endonuclease S subunit
MDAKTLSKFNIPVPPLEYQNKMEQTLNNFDGLNEGFNNMLLEIEDNSKTAFLNSLDDYGNPNSFNINKLIELDDEIKIKVPKNKIKSKSIDV